MYEYPWNKIYFTFYEIYHFFLIIMYRYVKINGLKFTLAGASQVPKLF